MEWQWGNLRHPFGHFGRAAGRVVGLEDPADLVLRDLPRGEIRLGGPGPAEGGFVEARLGEQRADDGRIVAAIVGFAEPPHAVGRIVAGLAPIRPENSESRRCGPETASSPAPPGASWNVKPYQPGRGTCKSTVCERCSPAAVKWKSQLSSRSNDPDTSRICQESLVLTGSWALTTATVSGTSSL